MTVSADTSYLPMLNPVRLPVREHQPTQLLREIPQDRPRRIYRMPLHEGPDLFAYGPAGSVFAEQSNGRVIDLYA